MSTSIFDLVRQSTKKLNKCDPLWLKKEISPYVEFQEGGTVGPNVLLLHGLFGAVSNWDSLFPKLTSFCRPIALKFPITTADSSEIKVNALVALTEYFIRKKNLGPLIICGNSLGGHVALRLALSSPELVSKLILSGASGLYEHSVDTLPIRPGKEFVKSHMEKVFYNKDFVTNEAIEEIVNVLTSKRSLLNLIQSARSAKRDNLYNELPNIKHPTLLLWGEDDEITTMDVARIFNKRISNSTLISVQKCGHAPMIEHPDWFASAIKDFI
jgi:pimeloyl-ACP methyl ester carboxylesterase